MLCRRLYSKTAIVRLQRTEHDHHMKHFFLLAALAFIAACNAQDADKSMIEEVSPQPRLLEQVYVSDTSIYARKAAAAFKMLSDSQRVAQMIMTTGGRLGKSQEDIADLIREGVVGGSIYLANDLEDHRSQVAESRAVGEQHAPIPLWFAIDAEPSLMYRRIVGGPAVTPAADMKNDDDVRVAVQTIDSLIADLGYNWNYAPVLDLGTENAAIKNRSFGFDGKTVADRSIIYVNETQADGILACVKHFPGHGLVQGDSHKGSVFIDGEMTEYGVYEQVLAEADPVVNEKI